MQLGIEHKIKALGSTLAVFTVIVLLLLLIHFRTPIPPYPEDGGQGLGLEINFGAITMVESITESSIEVANNIEKEKILTQDFEESEVVSSNQINKKSSIETKQKDQFKEPEPIIYEKALFKRKKNNDNTNNGATGSFGNNSNKGSGIGEGSGIGMGHGTGSGIGDGISFSLEGRSAISLIKPQGDFQTSGKVVVDITVDKNGNVINAIAGVKGSTTLDEFLLQLAREAALASKFSPQPNANIQKGTITYRFILQ